MSLHEVDIWDRGLQRIGDDRIFDDLESSVVVSAATAANPVALTTAAQTWSTGDLVLILAMDEHTELNGRVFRVTVSSTTAATLDDEDGSGRTAETTGGLAYKLPVGKLSKVCFDAWPEVRDEVLQDHPWNRCIKRTRLARKESAVTIDSATAANPVVCTAGSAHGYSTGDWVLLEAFDEMVEVNDRWFQITVPDGSTTTFNLNSEDGTDYTAESTGGTSKKAHDPPFKADTGYTYRYTIPTDCLRVLGLVESDSLWVVEQDELLTDDGITVPIRYIFRNTVVTSYSPALATTLAARLATEIIEAMTHDDKKVDIAEAKYERIKTRMKRADSLEQSPRPLLEDHWIVARDGSRTRNVTGRNRWV